MLLNIHNKRLYTIDYETNLANNITRKHRTYHNIYGYLRAGPLLRTFKNSVGIHMKINRGSKWEGRFLSISLTQHKRAVCDS